VILFVSEPVFCLFGGVDTQPSSLTDEFRVLSPPNVKPTDDFKIQNPVGSVERGRSRTTESLEPMGFTQGPSLKRSGVTAAVTDAPRITVGQGSSIEPHNSQSQRPRRDISPNFSRPLPSPHASPNRNLSPVSQSHSRAVSPDYSDRRLPSIPVKPSSPSPDMSSDYRFDPRVKRSPTSSLIEYAHSNPVPPKPSRRPSLTSQTIRPESAECGLATPSSSSSIPQRRDVGYLSPRTEDAVPNSFKVELNEKLSAGKTLFTIYSLLIFL
jgi:hypothetical protein